MEGSGSAMTADSPLTTGKRHDRALHPEHLAAVAQSSSRFAADHGVQAAIPLFGFVFLVALDVDDNIFLMTRGREEPRRNGVTEGILRGPGLTGRVITSAGAVLAATFAALAVIPLLFLAQIAFIVAFGVLLDTASVRSPLVPAASPAIGRAMWWHSNLSHQPLNGEIR